MKALAMFLYLGTVSILCPSSVGFTYSLERLQGQIGGGGGGGSCGSGTPSF